MRISKLTFTLAAITTLQSLAMAGANPMYGVIGGVVYDRQTRQPIAYANVVLLGSTLGTATDDNGRFNIPRVPVGIYHIQVSVIGYKPFIDSIRVTSSAGQSGYEFLLVEDRIQFAAVQIQAEQFAHSTDAPLSTRKFSQKELKNSAGGLDDIVRTVRTLPGVAQAKPDRTDLIVRGGATSENLNLLDDIEIPYMNHFSTQGAGGGAASIVDMDLVAGSSFSAGGFGARFADKLSSVLDVKLREGRTDQIHCKATVSPTQIGLNAEGPLSSDGSFIFSARKSYLDYAFKLYGFGFAPRFTDFTGKLTYTLGAKDKLTVLAVGAVDRIKYFNDTDEHRYENSRLLFSDQNHIVAAATLRHLFTIGYATITVRQAHSTFAYQQFTEDLTPQFLSSSVEDESSVRADAALECAPSVEMVFGTEIKMLGEKSSINLMPGIWAPRSDVLNCNPGTASAYVQGSKTMEALRITLGAKASYFGLLAQRLSIAPRLSAVLALSPLMNLNVSVGRYYQAPSSLWLASNDFNKNLSPIGVNQLVVGVDRHVSEDMSISVEGYIKQYFNYPASLNRPWLVMANTGAGPGGIGEGYASFGTDSLVSRGCGVAKGIEVTLQKKSSDIPCYGIMSISLSEARFSALDGVSRPGDYDQRVIATIGCGYALSDRWEVTGRFRLFTGRPYTPFDVNGLQSRDEYNSERVGVNHQLDFRVTRSWELSGAVLETYLDVQNIYNRKPIDAPIYSQRRQRVEQVPAMGIVPTIGLAVQF